MKRIISFLIGTVFCSNLFAQKKGGGDTTGKTVVITSAYKPILKPALKINFTPTTPFADTSKPALMSYSVPAQNLFFTYQPVALKPLALSVDSVLAWVNSNYIKAGYGNYSSPYLEAGLSFGDGKRSLVNFFGKHISQKGGLPYQRYGHTTFNVTGLYGTNSNIEWRSKIGFDNRSQFYYGYRPETLTFTKDSLHKVYNTISGMVGLRNKEVNDYGISYDPTLAVSLFSDNKSGNETNFIVNAPFSKVITPATIVNIGFVADVTTYKKPSGEKVTNNLYYIAPSLSLKKTNFSINAGITPSWDNGVSHLLPNFSGVVKVKDEKFVVIAGWTGSYQKNTYQSLSSTNPWIRQPETLFNTRILEEYAGFKGSAGSHFTYNARLSILKFNNNVLYLNDTLDGKTFNPTLETSMKAIRISGEIGYTVQEKFSLVGGAVINNFSGLEINDKAWGLLPLEITGSLRWQVLSDLQFKSDVFIWNGALYQTKNKNSERSGGAFDLNAGAEFTVAPHFNVWLQFNNIFNNKYERWHQYEVLGTNVLAGIVYSF